MAVVGVSRQQVSGLARVCQRDVGDVHREQVNLAGVKAAFENFDCSNRAAFYAQGAGHQVGKVFGLVVEGEFEFREAQLHGEGSC